MNPRRLAIFLIGAFSAASVMAESSGNKTEVRIDLDHPATSTAKATTSTPSTSMAGPKSTAAQPAAKTGSGKKSDDKKEQPPAKIEGMEISRGAHGYLGVAIKDGVFRITFYAPDKQPMLADVSRAVLRWPVHYQPNDERTLLTPADGGKVLTSEKVVRAPYTFKLFITLLKDKGPDQEPDAENYVVDFSQ